MDYQGVERWVRVNALDSDLINEDIRAAVAGGIDGIRLPKTETAAEIQAVAKKIEAAEKEFGKKVGSTMMMAAIESPLGIMNAYEIATADKSRMMVSH
ncbi:aldolase/citrate lyase family protein [Secundilactobacillus collinoides]|uniref:aldolase/citrate lyase family protein n=1 Tax=Secundilactobacillus collinoides TaxID=33960 RepID=UPI000B1AD7E0|nr:aldolase/citrate lyase family protein [Secundilactobacillus collinoides]